MTRMTLVLGVHRSGTSLLTAGLQAIGLDLGSLPAERDPDNPKGYFENHVIRAFNDKVLKALRASWDDSGFCAELAGLDGPAWAEWRQEAADLLRAQYGGRDTVALKDPRITQLLPFWIKVLDKLGWEQRHVLILRHPDEVAESQMQRAARRPGMFPRMNTPEAMHALWTRLMQTALVTLPPDKTLVVRNDTLLADPRKTLSALARQLGIRPDANALKRFAAEFVDRSLHRAHVTAPVPSPEREAAVQIWTALTKGWGRGGVKLLPKGMDLNTVRPFAETACAPTSRRGKTNHMTEAKSIDLPQWETDREAICNRIRAAKAPFKILLKTKNEPEFLADWIEHHAAIVGKVNLIIADNASTDPLALSTLSAAAETSVVYQFRGYHNSIHDRGAFPDLYKAVCASSDYYMFMDTDERLVLVDGKNWFADKQVVTWIEGISSVEFLPGLLLDNYPESTTDFVLASDMSFNNASVKWGKPLISSSAKISAGIRIHNLQFDRCAEFYKSPVNLVSLHFSRLYPKARMAANKRKLVARKVFEDTATFEDIAATPLHMVPNDGVSVRCVMEISKIMKYLSDPNGRHWGAPNPDELIQFLPDGCIEFGNQRLRDEFSHLVTQSIVQKEKSMSQASDITDLGLAAVAAGDVTKAEALLRTAIVEIPFKLDQYGDPQAYKELTRLLLSQGRFDEATDLVAKAPAIGHAGWYHILFGRAYDARGLKEQALFHWRKFAETRPNHIEAHDAIRGFSADKLSEPFQSIIKRVPTQNFDIIFDVGANVGQSAETFSGSLPQAQIHCFEPTPQSFAMLNQRLGSRTNLKFHQIALSDAEGSLSFSASGNSTMNRVAGAGVKDTIQVRSETLETFCSRSGIAHIDFLKIDTEGHDLSVIRGCGDFLKNIDFIQCEASANQYNRFHNSFTEIFGYLSSRGFYLFDIQGLTYEWANGGYPVLRRFDPIFINARIVGEMKNVVDR